MYKCDVIGISDSQQVWFPPRVARLIADGKVFSGGKRHHELVGHLLPPHAIWIDITVPLADVFRQYDEHQHVVIFASGDPLFYGFVSTIQQRRPQCQISVFPSFSSLQMLAHALSLPYQDLHAVSLTGRPWHQFDHALIAGQPMIGVLTDKQKNPHEIFGRMSLYGYDNYVVYVGEHLGNEELQRVGVYDSQAVYETPNCMILVRKEPRMVPWGIPDSDFHLLDGRAKMITKMPIRLITLSMLGLRHCHSFWDVGFCTGSVSIEAKLMFPHLHITAFEVRPQCEQIFLQNARQFGALGISTVMGDFLLANLANEMPPDAVFVGGHGGRLAQIVARIRQFLAPGGVIVFNSVSDDSRQLFESALSAVGMHVVDSHRVQLDEFNPITILKAR